MFKIRKKGEYVKLKNDERKINSPFIIYADFENTLVPKNNGKQNPDETYTNKYQKHVVCSYGYKLVCADDKFSNLCKLYLGESLSCSMIEENKYCIDIMKNNFNKEFEDFTKYWICNNVLVDVDVKVRDHCHITGKYRGFAHRDCNIKVKLNHKIPVICHNLKNYDSHIIMQELAKFNFKINVIPNGLEKYMSFNINNKLSFTDSFQFLSSSFDSLIKNLGKDDFK